MKSCVVIALLALCWLSYCEDLYTIKSNVTPLNKLNFQKQIDNQRIHDVNVILLYKEVNAQVIAVARKYEDFANEYKRVFRIFYINCEKELKLCESMGPAKYPAIRVYPPLPVPAFYINLDEILEIKTLVDNTASYLPKPDIEMLSSSNLNLFLENKPDKPKILLFSDRKTPSFMLKAISHAFYDTMCVGFVQNTENEVVNRFKVTKYPSLILVRRKNEKPITYNGELKLNSIFDFLNIYAEKFVTNTVKDQMKEESDKLLKPWLNEDIPELTKASINDVCLNGGRLCVIYLDTKEPNEDAKTLLKKFKEKYAADNKFSYMWLNTDIEKEFFSAFQVEQSELPKLVFLNTGSFKRILIHQGQFTQASLQATYDSIYNADARFTRMSSKTLPDLAQREHSIKTDL